MSVAACGPKFSALEAVSAQLPERPRPNPAPAPEVGAEATHGDPAGSGTGTGEDDATPGSAASNTGESAESGAPSGEGESDPLQSPSLEFTGTELHFTGAITFGAGAALLPASHGSLDEVAELLRRRPGIVKLEIQAHLDTKSAGDLMAITGARAQAVADYLMGRGIDGARLQPKGYGADMPVDTNRTAPGRAANRRVEFELLELADL